MMLPMAVGWPQKSTHLQLCARRQGQGLVGCGLLGAGRACPSAPGCISGSSMQHTAAWASLLEAPSSTCTDAALLKDSKIGSELPLSFTDA